MAIIVLPDAQEDLLWLQAYMLDKWSEDEWVQAENEIFDKLALVDSGLLSGACVQELASIDQMQTVNLTKRLAYCLEMPAAKRTRFCATGFHPAITSLHHQRINLMLTVGSVGQNCQDVFLRELREVFKHRLLCHPTGQHGQNIINRYAQASNAGPATALSGL